VGVAAGFDAAWAWRLVRRSVGGAAWAWRLVRRGGWFGVAAGSAHRGAAARSPHRGGRAVAVGRTEVVLLEHLLSAKINEWRGRRERKGLHHAFGRRRRRCGGDMVERAHRAPTGLR
jgi:hypothetical protein